MDFAPDTSINIFPIALTPTLRFCSLTIPLTLSHRVSPGTAIGLLPTPGVELAPEVVDKFRAMDSARHTAAIGWWECPRDDVLLLQAVRKEGPKYAHILRHYYQCPSDARPSPSPTVLQKRVQALLALMFPFVAMAFPERPSNKKSDGGAAQAQEKRLSDAKQREVRRVLIAWGKCADWEAFKSRSAALERVPVDLLSAYVARLLSGDAAPVPVESGGPDAAREGDGPAAEASGAASNEDPVSTAEPLADAGEAWVPPTAEEQQVLVDRAFQARDPRSDSWTCFCGKTVSPAPSHYNFEQHVNSLVHKTWLLHGPQVCPVCCPVSACEWGQELTRARVEAVGREP